ncbi:MAG: nucleotidyltransferase domain-containing protein [Coriobacteriia bacterium]|nr:nucleotidyltransferase domain-containing protein [Coriobacteriia bacterium]
MTASQPTHTITASDLAGRLGAVLDEVAQGSSFDITRHGVLIATVTPAEHPHVGETTQPLIAEESKGTYETKLPPTAMTRLIGTAATREVLAVFLRNPASVLHQREIARRAGLGLRSAQIALGRLEDLGLLESARDGNRRTYKAVRSRRFDDLLALFSRELGIAETIARHLDSVEAPVVWAFVFGSAASEADTVSSDIDLLVVSEASDDALVAPIAEAQRELGREIDVVSYTPAEFAAKRAGGNHFIDAILSQPRFDVVGGPDGS